MRRRGSQGPDKAQLRCAVIPKVLHQTWKSRHLPAEWAEFRRTWLEHHPEPEWRHELWTDADIECFVRQEHPELFPAWRRLPRAIQRVDAAKYLILQSHGGVYADLDCECLRPLDPLLERGGAILSRTPDGVIDGAVMASPPRHALWSRVIAAVAAPPLWVRLLRHLPPFRASYVLLSTGPQMLRRELRRYRRALRRRRALDAVEVLAPQLLSGRSWLHRYEPFPPGDAFVHHHHTDSWLTPAEARWHAYLTAGNVVRAALAVGTALLLLVAVRR